MSFNIGTSSTINATAASSVAKMDMALGECLVCLVVPPPLHRARPMIDYFLFRLRPRGLLECKNNDISCWRIHDISHRYSLFSPFSSSTPLSLDDIIKTSRRSAKKTPPSSSSSHANASRATGQNKARRNAQMNARRGISSNDKPTGMEIERQVNRQQRRTNATTTTAANASGVPQGNAKVLVGGGQQQRGGGRGRQSRATAPSESAIRAKARNAIIRAAAKTNGTNNSIATSVVTAPSQQAISAAAKAMKEMGFKCPKGMMMQISFVPKPGGGGGGSTTAAAGTTTTATTGHGGGTGGGRGGRGRNNRSGGRGGGRGGGGGGR